MQSLKEILSQYGFVFKRQLGQNFISDTNLLKSVVVDSGINETSEVLEIGTGAGTLTKAIADVAKKVVTYEIDNRLIPVIEDYLRDYDNVEVINKDILKCTDAEIENLVGPNFKVIANLPYYITSPVIMRFIESDLDVDSITVMVQKEVAERLVAHCGTSEYGAISVAVRIVADVKITRYVTRKLFYPPPNVDSAIVKITVNREKYKIEDMALLKRVIKSAFAMRRKTLSNNLMSSFKITRSQADEIIRKLSVDKNIRGEALDIDQFIELTNITGGEL